MATPLVTVTSRDIKGAGIGLVSEAVRIHGTNVVAKIRAISPAFPRELHDIEKAVYERVGKHPHILRYLGQAPPEATLLKGALLFEYHPHGVILPHIGDLPKLSARFLDALAHIHSPGIVHGDLGLHNLLLTDMGDLVLCDFARSGIDSRPPYIAHSMRYTDLCRRQENLTQQHDVFAMGTLMYELARKELLFEGLEDGDIYERLEKKLFPDTSDFPAPLKHVIEKCWMDPAYTAQDVLRGLEHFPSLAAGLSN